MEHLTHLVSRRARSERLGVDFHPSYPLGIAALIGAYYAAAHVGFAFSFAGPVAAIVWLPTGVGIASLYLFGLRFWPGVLAGDLLVNNYGALPIGSAVGQSCGNLLEIVLAAVLLRRLSRRGPPLASVSGVAGMVGAIAAGTLASATIGVVSLWAGGVFGGDSLVRVWRTWWLGDATGALILVPMALAWWGRPVWTWARGRGLEAAALIVALVVFSEIGLDTGAPLSYIVFPSLIWAALRFGQRGSTLAILIVAAFAIWGVTHYSGPFAFHSISRSVLSTQLYIAVAALSTLSLAAVVSEREGLEDRLRASRARLVAAADIERRRLERDLHDGAQQQLVALAARLNLSADAARGDPTRAPELFTGAHDALQAAIAELRVLAHGIRPPTLERSGLAGAVRSVALSASVPVDIAETGHGARLAESVENTAYFVILEALANAEKHAVASRVLVQIAYAPAQLQVEIEDDGLGGAVERDGRGLEGLRDRVEGIGGTFRFESAAGRGTRVSATLPA
jgi:signal transduction histidine kinase